MKCMVWLITGENRAHHGKILARAASIAEAGKLKPLLRDERFTASDIERAFARASAASLGKLVVEISG
jgi:NADPH2:quinone reductase